MNVWTYVAICTAVLIVFATITVLRAGTYPDQPRCCPQCKGTGWLEDHGSGWGPARSNNGDHGFTTRRCPGCMS